MSPLEYRDALKRLGLATERAAKFLGISTLMSRRRAVGGVAIPSEAALLLRLMLAMRLTTDDVETQIAGTN